jgi:hypothetical protein
MDLPFEQVLSTSPEIAPPGEELGSSREGRPIVGHRFGRGNFKISLIAGCHADEPIGPRTLRHLTSCLHALPPSHEARAQHEWWIVPHANPDGAARNETWAGRIGTSCDLVDYLDHVERELPGDDVEFGFPRCKEDAEARPENRAIHQWWQSDDRPFQLHVSLHGMAFAAGPWFLLEAAWRDQCEHLKERCRQEVQVMGYRLHDVDRRGEKGFVRLDPGFSTRPDSRAMAGHFRERGDEETAALFRPSSMEAVRSLGGNPLTMVSEMPLFVVPDLASSGPIDDSAMLEWRTRLGKWKMMLVEGRDREAVRREIKEAGIQAMPLRDQMRLQWTMIRAGIEQVRRTDER